MYVLSQDCEKKNKSTLQMWNVLLETNLESIRVTADSDKIMIIRR